MLRKNDDECVKKAWSFELEGSRGKGRPKLDWKTMMEKECCKVILKFLMPKIEQSGVVAPCHGKKVIRDMPK